MLKFLAWQKRSGPRVDAAFDLTRKNVWSTTSSMSCSALVRSNLY